MKYVDDIVIIGPVAVGKTSVAKCLARILDRPMISMDEVRVGYYMELGYNPDSAQELFEKDGAASLWCLWKAYDPYSVERILQDHRGYIIDMGGGSTVHEHDDQLERVKRTLEPYRNVVLLLPYPAMETSLEFLDARTGWGGGGRNVNRIILQNCSNYQLASITVYTAGKSSEEIAREIISLSDLNN